MLSITLKELKALNRAIDNKCIVGIKNSGNNIEKQDMNFFAEAKVTMIKKRILKDFYHFTTEGAHIFGRLKEYKNAKRYIELQGVWMGICDGNVTIAINQNGYDSYQINTIQTDSIIKAMKERYKFINSLDNGSYSEVIDHLDYRDISNKYLIGAKCRFRLSKVEGDKMTTSFFFFDGNDRTGGTQWVILHLILHLWRS